MIKNKNTMKKIFSSLLITLLTCTFINAETGLTFTEALETVQEKITISFTLRNTSLKSIPLKIPGVMNPNLSPQSNSGVSLKIGQKIFFRHNGKKQLLLVVSKEYEGQTLNVPKLIKERKKELGLK